ncbi:unnamed protein product [Diamesa serratosioi]
MILTDPMELLLLNCTKGTPTVQIYKVKRKQPMTKVMKEFCKISGLKFENIQFFSDAHGFSLIPFYKEDETAVLIEELDLRHKDTIFVTNNESIYEALKRVQVFIRAHNSVPST